MCDLDLAPFNYHHNTTSTIIVRIDCDNFVRTFPLIWSFKKGLKQFKDIVQLRSNWLKNHVIDLIYVFCLFLYQILITKDFSHCILKVVRLVLVHFWFLFKFIYFTSAYRIQSWWIEESKCHYYCIWLELRAWIFLT